MSGRLSGKVCIVTGAGSSGPGWGNGKAAAVLFAREGASVLAVDMNPEASEATAAIIREEGGSCLTAAADVASEDDVTRVVGQCLDHFGRVDVLHNNVGIGSHGGPMDTSVEAWDNIFAVNVRGPYLTCKHVLPAMIRQGAGSIINVSSINAIRDTGIPQAAYNASKAAVNQLTQSIAVHHAAQGVRCNAILPGLIDTPMIRQAGMVANYKGGIEEMIAQRDRRCPGGKMGTAWDVAYAALFLASDEARFVNATSLIVDGGLTATIR
jgi:NAD(P)-dependent dehydrogenase (short-subunit alcohol dehydrogenase family)